MTDWTIYSTADLKASYTELLGQARRADSKGRYALGRKFTQQAAATLVALVARTGQTPREMGLSS